MLAESPPVHGALVTTRYDDTRVHYFGIWTDALDQAGPGSRRSNIPYNACVLAFQGPDVRWLGTQGPDHGRAEVYVDGVLEGIIDTYRPMGIVSQVLFEKTGLDAERIHTLRIVVTEERSPAATNYFQTVEGFESSWPVDYPQHLRQAAAAELSAITGGTKTYLGPESWRPVHYSAAAPSSGVTLQEGRLRDCFERNVRYLIRCFAAPFYSDAGDNNWVQSLPASAEGRLLAGAGHTLRWGERPEMRQIVDTIVPAVKKRQTDDGYCLPYDVGFMGQQPVGFMDERRNYDRVGLTRGLIAAGMAGNADAYAILRRFYDWLYASPYALKLIAGSGYHMSAHNCNNGHEGSLLMHFSPVGTDGDLIAAERAFVQDFFIEQARNAEPLSLTYYPLHTPHSYVLLAFEAWVDHYRATGASKYLEAARGAWQFVTNSFEHVGGTIAICEMGPGSYPPGSYHLRKHTGETCGSVFWADFNHRLLQLYPDDERYAAAIERAIYNVILAAQGDDGSIRYHNHLHLAKEDPTCSNTCCEVMGVPFIARLPQYIYSIADDGLYVNLYVPSSIAWEHDGQSISVELATGFPHTQEVSLTVSTTTAVHLAVRLRVPGWASDTVPVQINGELAGEGAPGSYLSLEREWVDGDRISFGLPSSFRLSRYNGLDQISGTARYALELGPLLMALAGPQDKHYRQPDASPCASLSLSSEELIPALEPVLGQPLHFRIRGHAEHVYMPYYDVSSETFTCFPVLGA